MVTDGSSFGQSRGTQLILLHARVVFREDSKVNFLDTFRHSRALAPW